MIGENKYYITTAIDYPNARPHIGTAFEKIGADVQARFQRFQGKDVFFLMGNDENTIKVVRRAQELNEPVKQYVDRLAGEFKAVWKALNISYDDFIQTSEDRHRKGVEKFIQAAHNAGAIYKKTYSGWYCEGCEEFKLEKNLQIVEGKKVCPNHPLSIVLREEENYFFKLSAFKQWILDLLTPTPFLTAFTDVQPECRLNEINNFVESDLHDISISRNNEGWGIPIPWDNSQVVYVWFDALLNYLTGIGYGTDEAKFNKWWPANCHVIGKDITRFHCALWPAMIRAYNTNNSLEAISFPELVYAHGFIYQNKGEQQVKVSKSGSSYVDPLELVNKYGCDAYRYYFLSKCSFNGDGEYSPTHFNEVYNSELANNLGNLASRTCQMVIQYAEGRLPKLKDKVTIRFDNKTFDVDTAPEVQWFTPEDITLWHKHTTQFEYREALQIVWKVLNTANQYIEQEKPWALAKKIETKPRCLMVLRNLVACLRMVSILLKPYLPETAEKIYSSFIFSPQFNGSFDPPHGEDKLKFDDVRWDDLEKLGKNNYEGLEEHLTMNASSLVPGELFEGSVEIRRAKYPILFPRIVLNNA